MDNGGRGEGVRERGEEGGGGSHKKAKLLPTRHCARRIFSERPHLSKLSMAFHGPAAGAELAAKFNVALIVVKFGMIYLL
jgi:hypothetical protein